jgi:hypothetical protein
MRVLIMGRMRSVRVGLRLLTMVVHQKVLKMVGDSVEALTYLLLKLFGEGVQALG